MALRAGSAASKLERGWSEAFQIVHEAAPSESGASCWVSNSGGCQRLVLDGAIQQATGWTPPRCDSAFRFQSRRNHVLSQRREYNGFSL